jgi:hypothetical protein
MKSNRTAPGTLFKPLISVLILVLPFAASVLPFVASVLPFAVPTPASAQDKPAPGKPSQDKPAPDKPARSNCLDSSSCTLKTFYLTNISQQHDANEIVTAMRNMLEPYVKIYFVASQNAITVEALPDQLRLAQEILHDLDRPNKTYRLTYTIAEMDGQQNVGIQHFSMIVVAGQRTVLKQGDKIPVATGTYGIGNTGASGLQTQFTYMYVGMDFDASLDEFANGVRLQSKVSQSSLGQPSTIAGVLEPVVRQVDLEGTSFLSPGKPIILGSIDISGTTRHDDISVVMEQVP